MFNGSPISRSVADAAKQILEKGPKLRTPDDPLKSLVRGVEEQKEKEQKKNQPLNEGKTLKTVGKIAKHVARNVGLYGGAAYGASTGDWEKGIVVGSAVQALGLAARSGTKTGEDQYHEAPPLQRKDKPFQPSKDFMPDINRDPQYQSMKSRLGNIKKFFKGKK